MRYTCYPSGEGIHFSEGKNVFNIFFLHPPSENCSVDRRQPREHGFLNINGVKKNNTVYYIRWQPTKQ